MLVRAYVGRARKSVVSVFGKVQGTSSGRALCVCGRKTNVRSGSVKVCAHTGRMSVGWHSHSEPKL